MRRRTGRVVAAVALAVAVLAGIGAGVVVVNRDDQVPSATGPDSSDASSPAGPEPTITPKPDQSNTPSPPPDLAGVFAGVKSGVVRVLASTCSGTGIGTGFLTDARTVMAALGSVKRAVAVVAIVGGRPTPATVDSVSPDTGLATLRLARPVAGYHFALGAAPTVGQQVGVVGVPVDDTAPTLTKAAVTATDERGSGLSGLLTLEGSADLGLSGAPVVDGSGGVVGMVVADDDEIELKAMPATTLDGAATQPPDEGSCGLPRGPQIPTVITGDAPKAARATLRRYFHGINTGDYDAVFDAVEPGVLKGSRSKIEKGFRSSYDFHIRIVAWDGQRAWVRFDSIFALGRGPSPSLTCARWSRVYVFGGADGGTRIGLVENRLGVPLYRSC